jgi:hypothetical protein
MILAARLSLPILAVLLGACSRLPERALIPVPPATLPQGWQRVAMDTPPLVDIPATLATLKPTHRVRASYRRQSSTLAVDAYAMSSQAVAFEAQQTWRNQPGSIAFHHGNIFVICTAAAEPTSALASLSKILEDAWLGGRR